MKSYFLRKIEYLEKSVKGKKPTLRDFTCPYCKKGKKPYSKMCKDCFESKAFEI